MTYYDHATAMAFKLDRWREERPLGNVELEVLACAQRSSDDGQKKQSLYRRCVSVFQFHHVSDETDESITGKH